MHRKRKFGNFYSSEMIYCSENVIPRSVDNENFPFPVQNKRKKKIVKWVRDRLQFENDILALHIGGIPIPPVVLSS